MPKYPPVTQKNILGTKNSVEIVLFQKKFRSLGNKIKNEIIPKKKMTNNKGNIILYTLLIKNNLKEKFFFSNLVEIMDVIKNPDITKNMSTPKYPYGKNVGKKWKSITDKIASPLSPWISSLK